MTRDLDAFHAAAARPATAADRELVRAWSAAFAVETGGSPGREAHAVDDRIADGRCMLWAADGRPVSMAGVTRTLARTARVVWRTGRGCGARTRDASQRTPECHGRSRGWRLRVMVLSPGVAVRRPYGGVAWPVRRNPPLTRPVHFATALKMEVP